MPKGSVDYQKGLIYTIKTGDSLYVGSTTNFRERKYTHLQKIKTLNSKLYHTIRENDCEWDMKPYKEFPCNSKLQLEIEEEKIRRELNADLNMLSCSGIDEEKKRKTQKRLYEENKEERKKNNKLYREQNKEKLKELDRIKYQKNKEKKKQQAKDFYNKKKEAILQKQKERVICECGCCVSYGMLTQHKKSQKHQNFIKSINTE
tara:strand:+ start:115 stop:726 length:612 start_codon:yes stop_codon:yes gene_type:complete